MSKASQYKRSMYQLGYQDGKHYLPRFRKNKEYMHGWNKRDAKELSVWLNLASKPKVIAPYILLGFLATILIGALLQ